MLNCAVCDLNIEVLIFEIDEDYLDHATHLISTMYAIKPVNQSRPCDPNHLDYAFRQYDCSWSVQLLLLFAKVANYKAMAHSLSKRLPLMVPPSQSSQYAVAFVVFWSVEDARAAINALDGSYDANLGGVLQATPHPL